MRRRDFIKVITGSAAAWPLAASAQQTAMPVVGFFNPGNASVQTYLVEGFRRGLAEAGYSEGRNVAVEYRWADGHYDRLPEIAADLVRRRVEVIVAGGSSAPGLAAKAATSTIPIVFQTGADPVADGLVSSMNRPRGNITGVSRMTVALEPKRLELLHDVVPKASVFAMLVNQNSPRADFEIEQVQKAAKSLGYRLEIVKIGVEEELEGVFDKMAHEKMDALVVENDPTMQEWDEKIVALTIRHAIPTMFNNRRYVVKGGLMSYDSSLVDSYRQVGTYVGRILKGEKPAELPILEPTKFDLALNLKTAKTLALAIPLKMQAFADEVIE
jgi:putative ABC transport system substrate-binding protein